MNTINYAVEYLVAGSVFMLSLLLLSIAIFGPWYIEVNLLDTLTKDEGRVVALVIALFPFVYWFGIVLDRFADSITENMYSLKIKNNLMCEIAAEYNIDCQKAFTRTRSYIYYHAPELAKIFEQNRVKLRVCRNCFVNALILTGSLLILTLSSSFEKMFPNSHITTGNIQVVNATFVSNRV